MCFLKDSDCVYSQTRFQASSRDGMCPPECGRQLIAKENMRKDQSGKDGADGSQRIKAQIVGSCRAQSTRCCGNDGHLPARTGESLEKFRRRREEKLKIVQKY